MKIELYDVVRLKDGRELTILLIHDNGAAFEVTDQEDVFSVERSEIEKVIWKYSNHANTV